MSKTLWLALVFGLSFSSAVAEDSNWTSKGGAYVVRYQSELQPMQINKLHAWIIHVQDAAGEPVEGVVIEATGGMPVHDHGMPTRPRVTEALGNGDYRLEGMRFHMAGLWEITLLIRDGEVTDTVMISLTL